MLDDDDDDDSGCSCGEQSDLTDLSGAPIVLEPERRGRGLLIYRLLPRTTFAWGNLQRDATLQFQDVVEGYMVQLSNADESRTFAYITMHEHRLYVYEGTAPKGAPEPGIFNNSVGFVDAKGQGIRYTDYYSNAIHGLRQQDPPPYRAGGALIGPGGVVLQPPNPQGGQGGQAAPAVAPVAPR